MQGGGGIKRTSPIQTKNSLIAGRLSKTLAAAECEGHRNCFFPRRLLLNDYDLTYRPKTPHTGCWKALKITSQLGVIYHRHKRGDTNQPPFPESHLKKHKLPCWHVTCLTVIEIYF